MRWNVSSRFAIGLNLRARGSGGELAEREGAITPRAAAFEVGVRRGLAPRSFPGLPPHEGKDGIAWRQALRRPDGYRLSNASRGSCLPPLSTPCGSRARTAVLVTFTVLFAAPGAARAQTPDPQDYRLVTRVPREELDRWLKDEMRRSGGDLDAGRYHFVVGFSTGHYGSDPVHAIATRRLAFSLLNNTLAPGDRVTAEAWEMKVWRAGSPITLTTDPKTRAAFVDAVPYAPAAGSRGGHDTERALYETLQRLSPAQAKSSLVLLLTNSNQSQGPTGSRAELFGANNRLLDQEILRLGYREPVRHSFTAQSNRGPLTIDVTALFPKKVAPLPGAPTTRRYPTFPVETWQPPADRPAPAEALPNPVQPASAGTPAETGKAPKGVPVAPDAPPGRGFPWPLLVLALLLLGLVGVLVLWLRNRGPRAEAPAEKPEGPEKGRPIPGSVKATVGSAPAATTVTLSPLTTASRWTLVREDGAPPVLSDADEPPGVKLARLAVNDKRRLTLEAEGDVLFQNVAGIKADAANPRQLVLAPGDHLVCRVTPASTAQQPVRLELTYTEKT